jgi:hypothetical protein
MNILWCMLAVTNLAFWFSSSEAKAQLALGSASFLKGKVGAAGEFSPEKIFVNPAHLANTPQHYVGLSINPAFTDYFQRYPGFATYEKSDFSFFGGLPTPFFGYKIDSRLAISAMVIPFSVGIDIDKKRLPLILLGQQQNVDLVGQGSLEFLASSVLAFRMNDQLSMGVTATYASFGGDVELKASGSSAPLVGIDAAITNTSLDLGVLFKVNSSMSLGLSGNIFKLTDTAMTLESPLLDASEQSDGGLESPSDSGTSFLGKIRAGMSAKLNRKISIDVDLEYENPAERSEFSIKDLKEKPKDLYPTVSLYSSAKLQIRRSYSAVVGACYEPSSVGPGSSDDNGKTGFGMMDILTGLGEPPTRPQWRVSAGMQLGLSRIRNRSRKRGKRSKIGYRYVLEFGISYFQTSIGISESGEQPGAYFYDGYQFPVSLVAYL